MIEVIGWISSIVLLLTLIKQVHKQWRERNSEGVSKWLFVGQLIASTGFLVYSFLIGNWVFLATNILLTINNILGIYFYFRFMPKSD
jgi:MtN3 and saliva related transmembrane protein